MTDNDRLASDALHTALAIINHGEARLERDVYQVPEIEWRIIRLFVEAAYSAVQGHYTQAAERQQLATDLALDEVRKPRVAELLER